MAVACLGRVRVKPHESVTVVRRRRQQDNRVGGSLGSSLGGSAGNHANKHSRLMPQAAAARKDLSEVEFLKREVVDLERVIKSLHSSRSDDRYALEQAEAMLVRVHDESAMVEGQQRMTQNALADLRSQHTAALAAAAAREAETRMLGIELQLLCAELFDAEAEREAARESESSALSIARSYRGFAAQGAARLEDMRGGIEGVGSRIALRLAAYQTQAQYNYKVRALRSVRGWRAARELSRSLTRWMLLVFTAEQRAAVATRLEAAYRHRDVQNAAQRMQAANERREEQAAAAAARESLEARLSAAERERDAALQTAQVPSAPFERAQACD